MIKQTLAATLALTIAGTAIAEASNKDRILARECVTALKRSHNYSGNVLPENWSRYSYSTVKPAGDMCKVFSIWTLNSIVAGYSKGACATYYGYKQNITIKGTNRFGDTDNNNYTCIYTGSNYTFQAAFNFKF